MQKCEGSPAESTVVSLRSWAALGKWLSALTPALQSGGNGRLFVGILSSCKYKSMTMSTPRLAQQTTAENTLGLLVLCSLFPGVVHVLAGAWSFWGPLFP